MYGDNMQKNPETAGQGEIFLLFPFFHPLLPGCAPALTEKDKYVYILFPFPVGSKPYSSSDPASYAAATEL